MCALALIESLQKHHPRLQDHSAELQAGRQESNSKVVLSSPPPAFVVPHSQAPEADRRNGHSTYGHHLS